MTAPESLLQPLVTVLMDAGLKREIARVRRLACEGKSRAERAAIMVALAKAQLAHPKFRRRSGLSE